MKKNKCCVVLESLISPQPKQKDKNYRKCHYRKKKSKHKKEEYLKSERETHYSV